MKVEIELSPGSAAVWGSEKAVVWVEQTVEMDIETFAVEREPVEKVVRRPLRQQ